MNSYTPLMRMLYGLAILFFSCNASPATGQDQKAATSSTEKSSSWPEPAGYVEGIPVYEEYGQLAPLFEQKNDTAYVINFWATWCKPCVEELPHFEELISTYKDKKVKIVLVSLDFPRQLKSKLVPFVEEHQLKAHVVALLDGRYNDWIDKVSPEWSGAIPATLVYKGEQRQFIGTSVKSMAELETALKPMLN